MNQLTEIMISRLEKKGVQLDIIPGFIRDLVNTISIDHQSNLQELNKKLHLLGWDDFELDDYTLQLVIASVEAEDFTKQSAVQAQDSKFSY